MKANWQFNERKIEAGNRPRSVFEYYVTGSGDFPADMLRYDAAWPMSSQDAGDMEMNLYDNPHQRRRRTVGLRSYNAPTVARWRSFNWSVSADRGGIEH